METRCIVRCFMERWNNHLGPAKKRAQKDTAPLTLDQDQTKTTMPRGNKRKPHPATGTLGTQR